MNITTEGIKYLFATYGPLSLISFLLAGILLLYAAPRIPKMPSLTDEHKSGTFALTVLCGCFLLVIALLGTYDFAVKNTTFRTYAIAMGILIVIVGLSYWLVQKVERLTKAVALTAVAGPVFGILFAVSQFALLPNWSAPIVLACAIGMLLLVIFVAAAIYIFNTPQGVFAPDFLDEITGKKPTRGLPLWLYTQRKHPWLGFVLCYLLTAMAISALPNLYGWLKLSAEKILGA